MCYMWNFHYIGKSNSHTCLQCHPHDKDEWGDMVSWHWAKSQLLTSCLHRHTYIATHTHTHLSLYIYNYFSKFAIIWAANAYAAILVPETCDANMHTNMLTQHWIQTVLVSTGGPRPGGPATSPTVHSKVLWSWPHMQVPQGHVGGISLSEKAITRSSCCDPPSCGHRSSCPPSRCETCGHLQAPAMCVCGYTLVSVLLHYLALDAGDLSGRWIGLGC